MLRLISRDVPRVATVNFDGLIRRICMSKRLNLHFVARIVQLIPIARSLLGAGFTETAIKQAKGRQGAPCGEGN